MMFWPLFILKLVDLFVESAQKKDIVQFMKRKKHSCLLQRRKHFRKTRIEVQFAHTNGVERVKRFVNAHLHCIVRNLK